MSRITWVCKAKEEKKVTNLLNSWKFKNPFNCCLLHLAVCLECFVVHSKKGTEYKCTKEWVLTSTTHPFILSSIQPDRGSLPTEVILCTCLKGFDVVLLISSTSWRIGVRRKGDVMTVGFRLPTLCQRQRL